MSVKCEPNNMQVAACGSVNVRVVSYNSTSLWAASCVSIVRLWVGESYQSALSVYTISSLHVKQSKSKKATWYIPIMTYTWEQPWDLLWFKWKWIRRICKYLCNYRLITEAAVHRQQKNCSANFVKFFGKQPQVEYYFRKVIELYFKILLKQDQPWVFSWKLSKIFRTAIFCITPLDDCFWIYK